MMDSSSHIKNGITSNVFLMDCVKGKEPDGSVATKIMRDASLKIYVQGYRAFSKGRYIGTSEYYSIWPEKEEEIWLER